MGKDEKKSLSFFSTDKLPKKPKASIQTEKQLKNSQTPEKKLESSHVKANNTMRIESEEQEIEENWEIVGAKRLNKIQKTETKLSSSNNTHSELIDPRIQSEGVHSYFSFGRAEPKVKSGFNKNRLLELPRTEIQHSTQVEMNDNIIERNKNLHLPPFKLEFKDQQKPPEIQVLNDLVKYNNRLNISAASYSKNIQSTHVLLLFVNDSSTYELLFNKNAWPHLICNLPFQVILPRRVPPSYSVLVNRIPREWNLDTIQPLLIERYTSTHHITRIFRDGQATTRIRIDFYSQNDVQSITQNGYIYIDSIRYPATSYKPLLRIDRCYKCQQFGHKFHDCTNEPKCYKCGEFHHYNPNCTNPIKCANCAGSHMAGSPECPVKISYRKQQQQQQPQQRQQQTTRMINPTTTATYLPSPARLYSTVLQTMSSNIDSTNHATDTPRPSTFKETDSSSAIITTIKDELIKSQNILLERLIQLERKCEAATQQQLTSQHMIKTEIIPYLMSMSDLIVNIYDTLVATQSIQLTEQQQTKLSHIRKLSTIYQIPLSQSLRPLLSRTRAQPNLCSSLTSISNQPQLASIPSESNIDENLSSFNNYLQ